MNAKKHHYLLAKTAAMFFAETLRYNRYVATGLLPNAKIRFAAFCKPATPLAIKLILVNALNQVI
ncbi:MAG: hypothetical protein Q7U18_14010 [Methylobacter sp.]|nr:hypothetical protein [Methylobacter sp.]